MGTGIAITDTLYDWDVVESGGGSVTISADGKKANCTGTAHVGKGYIRKIIPARAGERVTFSFIARRISGQPKASIDYPTSGTSKGIMEINTDEFREYTLEYIVPVTADGATEYVQCTAGVFTTEEGEVEVLQLRVEVSESAPGFLRVWCAGLLEMQLSGGVVTPSLNPRYINAGIKSITWEGGGVKRLYITMQKSPNSELGLRPILSAEITTDNAPSLVAKAGRYNPTTGTFEVGFTNGSEFFVDVADELENGESLYLSVWAMGL